MNQKELLAFAKEAAKSMKTEKDLSDFSRMLKKVTVEAALGAELDDHLGYNRNQPSTGVNNRNGHTSKTLYTDDGVIDIEVPRDRDSSFERNSSRNPVSLEAGQGNFRLCLIF